MRRIPTLAALFIACILPHQAFTQATANDPTLLIPRLDIALGYNHIHANAPPSGCGCFDMNGAFISAGVPLRSWLSLAVEATGGHANDISVLGQDLTLITATAGPRINLRRNRFLVFGQGLVGIAHGSDSYFPTATSFTTSANSLAFSAGGGLDFELTHRFAVRALEFQYLHTEFNNGVNTSQNQIQFGAGIIVKFGSAHAHVTTMPTPAPAPKPGKFSMSCSADFRNVEAGQPLEVTALMRSDVDDTQIQFDWSTDGGTVTKTGTSASIDTTGLAAGRYKVIGHTSISTGQTAQCEVAFRIVEPQHPVVITLPPPPPTEPAAAALDRDFHQHMRDAFFDYDKSDLRPDALAAIAANAAYLLQHPEMNTLLGGYSDERGTVAYNLELGARRAAAVRDALIAAGIPADKLEIVSFGKGSQVCAATSEDCFQKNRRTTFFLRP